VQKLQPGDRDIAFVFQLFALYPHLTAYDNIAFPLRATRESKESVDQKVRAVARSLQIEHLLGKRPSALAGGDMQRIAIGRALVRRPKAMLMDEPIGALDAALREEMRTELKRLHLENDQTTVYVTHDQVEAMSLADRIAIMNEGVLQQVGTPTDVYQHPANLFVAQFIGSPVMNISQARLQGDGDSLDLAIGDGAGTFRFPAELQHHLAQANYSQPDLTIGIRPEGVMLARQAAEGFIPARPTSLSRSAPMTSST
jgi:multiple sugar transport system ATP-binding protein